MDIRFAPPALPTAGALVLFATSEQSPLGGSLFAEADQACGGAIGRAVEAAEFKAKSGGTLLLQGPGGGLSRIVVAGLGEAAKITPRIIEEAAGSAIALLSRDERVTIAADGLDTTQAAHAAMGAALRAWRFDRYRTTETADEKPRLATVEVLTGDVAATQTAWSPLAAIRDGVFLTRDLVSEPGNILNPATMAERCQTALTPLGVTVEVMGPAELEALGFGALLAVARGSVNEARMVVMRWHGTPDAKPAKGKTKDAAVGPVALIGKGVTFDSGVISIKPAGGMEDMKWDMAGAGAVIGAMAAIAGRKSRADVVGIVGLVENMPSGNAYRPGDVVTSASGKTVEIINTDAEGRMVLCDVLHYAADRFKPRLMVDLATLTGAIIVSLGHEHGGMFASDDTLANDLTEAGRETGEPLWRMPLGEAYDKQLKSDIADMKHVTGRPGSAITAACFLQRFTHGLPWAHLDVAGMVWSSKDTACVPKGATAYGVRLLDRLVALHHEG